MVHAGAVHAVVGGEGKQMKPLKTGREECISVQHHKLVFAAAERDAKLLTPWMRAPRPKAVI